MKVYLDNNVVSAIAKDDHPAESEALSQILEAREERKCDLVTSELTLQEIKKTPVQHRPPIERTFRLLEKVPIERWDELVGMHSYGDARTWINTPLIQNDSDYDALLKLGLDVTDAQHVFVAAKRDCDVFLTCDKGILRYADNIKKRLGLVVQRPSAFVKNQGWQTE